MRRRKIVQKTAFGSWIVRDIECRFSWEKRESLIVCGRCYSSSSVGNSYQWLFVIVYNLLLGIVITKTAPAVLACSRSDLSRLCKSLWTSLWRIPLFCTTHYTVWHNRNEVYVKKLYIVAMIVLNVDISKCKQCRTANYVEPRSFVSIEAMSHPL